MLEPLRLDWVESNLAQGKANLTEGSPTTQNPFTDKKELGDNWVNYVFINTKQ